MLFNPALAILGIVSAPTLALECSVSVFAALLPSHASINSVTKVSENGTFGGPSSNIPFPIPDVELPELCAVNISVISSSSSSYNFGLYLPTSWNSRFATSGNGGFGGGINWNDMALFSRRCFASMSTDTGHSSAAFDASWALDAPERQLDWGYRALHGSVSLAKVIVEAYYSQPIKYSYYASCSTGGRQGLKELQNFPEDFDGVLAGAPAWWTTHLQGWSLWVGTLNLPSTADFHIPASMFPIIQQEVLRQCDPQDGVTDKIISDPYGCNFYYEALLCDSTTTNRSTCLTAPQLNTLKRIHSPWVDANQTFVSPSFAFGSEGVWSFLLGPTDSNVPSPAGTSYYANFIANVTDGKYDWTTFDFSTVQFADSFDPGHPTADNFDLSPFAARGGKLIHYHGLADAFIPAGFSLYFYQQVLQKMLPNSSMSQVSDFYRLFLVPGMGHCSGSTNDAPWYIAAGGQQVGITTYGVPGYEDSRHDALLALMAWVEEGKAPHEIVATKFVDDDANKGVVKQRPLCPYPKVAKWDGERDVDKAGSWSCGLPY